MTSLFIGWASGDATLTMPNNNFKFNHKAYSSIVVTYNGTLYFFGTESFNFYNDSSMATSCSYKFVSNNTKLLVRVTGHNSSVSGLIFTADMIITQDGYIKVNYSISLGVPAQVQSNPNIGIWASLTNYVILTLNGTTFNGQRYLYVPEIYGLLNGKTIMFGPSS